MKKQKRPLSLKLQPKNGHCERSHARPTESGGQQAQRKKTTAPIWTRWAAFAARLLTGQPQRTERLETTRRVDRSTTTTAPAADDGERWRRANRRERARTDAHARLLARMHAPMDGRSGGEERTPRRRRRRQRRRQRWSDGRLLNRPTRRSLARSHAAAYARKTAAMTASPLRLAPTERWRQARRSLAAQKRPRSSKL